MEWEEKLRAGGGDVGDDRGQKFNLTPHEGTNFDLSHRHSGLHGDGQPIAAGNLDTSVPFKTLLEPIYLPVNAATSGRKYRIQIIEVTDPDTLQIQAVLQVVPA